MFKSLKNLTSAVADLVVIGSKEVAHQATKAANNSNTVTSKLAEKAAAIREAYEISLASRKESVDGVLIVRAPENMKSE